MVRDGVPIYFKNPVPQTLQAQPMVSDPEVGSKVKSKMMKVVHLSTLESNCNP